jgi:hypothetical protein
MLPVEKDYWTFYTFEVIFIIFIILFISLYIKTKNNNYLIFGIVFFIIQIIYSVFALKYIFIKYKVYQDLRKSRIPIYFFINNLLIIFITLFMAFFIKNKNYLFLILAIICIIIHFFYNTILIGWVLNISNSLNLIFKN